MNIFIQSLISGILIGGVYALIGIGLTIIFGVMRVINFAHGDLLMLGMYGTYYLFTLFNIDPFVSIVFTIPLMFLYGGFLQKFFINRVLGSLPQNQILLTIGMGLIMSNVVMLAFTSDYKILSTTYSSSSVSILGISIPLDRSPLLHSKLLIDYITQSEEVLTFFYCKVAIHLEFSEGIDLHFKVPVAISFYNISNLRIKQKLNLCIRCNS